MKTNILKMIPALLLVAIFIGTTAMAGPNDDRSIDKAREAVENAGPDDWYTLAANAEKCFKKNTNIKEAGEWLDRSLAIIETPYNLELKGDYYKLSRLPDKALEYYVKAMSAKKGEDGHADLTDIQLKIAKIVNIGG